MLTGDNQATADAIAKELGIDRVVARVMPDGKSEKIKRLQKNGHAVAFIGDGSNHAAALAAADVGIAMEAGDIVLMRADLTGAVNAIALSRRTIGHHPHELRRRHTSPASVRHHNGATGHRLAL